MSTEWTSLDDEWPEEKRHVLVTNNLTARNAHGQMSHLWLTSFVQRGRDGRPMTFNGLDQRVQNLTHWRYALPSEPTP